MLFDHYFDYYPNTVINVCKKFISPFFSYMFLYALYGWYAKNLLSYQLITNIQ